jgi:3-deoxy-D-manno-octulosonic-acid transferase
VFLLLFRLGTHIGSLFNAKAAKWVKGRRGIFERLELTLAGNHQVIWMHCASLGEFEQGRPVLEKLRIHFPKYKLLLTFFSPSGYEVRKNFEGADWVFYLPMDGAANSRRFLEIVKPSLVIFVKYEFWYYYLKKIKYRNIPLVLISALFREDMSFFKWYGGLQRKILSRFDHLFVQNEESRMLIENIGLAQICSVSGDTRFDRVSEIASRFIPLPAIEKFIAETNTIVAGSTWPEDEEALAFAFSGLNKSLIKLIIAPHDISEKHLVDIETRFPSSVRYSLFHQMNVQSNVLIIDNIGMLSSLYNYAYITYIGGGLRKSGIHNVLEAAVFNKPVIFGPNYTKYSEAIGLVRSGGGISFDDGPAGKEQLLTILNELTADKSKYDQSGVAAGKFVRDNVGATEKIMKFIQENRLLTS